MRLGYEEEQGLVNEVGASSTLDQHREQMALNRSLWCTGIDGDLFPVVIVSCSATLIRFRSQDLRVAKVSRLPI